MLLIAVLLLLNSLRSFIFLWSCSSFPTARHITFICRDSTLSLVGVRKKEASATFRKKGNPNRAKLNLCILPTQKSLAKLSFYLREFLRRHRCPSSPLRISHFTHLWWEEQEKLEEKKWWLIIQREASWTCQNHKFSLPVSVGTYWSCHSANKFEYIRLCVWTRARLTLETFYSFQLR